MAYIYDLVDSWSSSGTTFTAIKMNVTDTASSASSMLIDLQRNTVSQFTVRRDGFMTTSGALFGGSGGVGVGYVGAGILTVPSGGRIELGSSGVNNADTFLTRRAAANLRFGAADAAVPVAQILSVQSVATGTANTSGANFTITGSQGTGTGAGGSIIFQVAPATTNGSTPNALTNALRIIPGTPISGSATNSAIFPGISNNVYISSPFDYGIELNCRGNNGYAVALNGGATGVFIGESGFLAWSSTISQQGRDLFLAREEFGGIIALAQRNGTLAQTFRLYDTYTDVSNYSRLVMYSAGSGSYYIGTQKAGTGTSASLYVGTGAGSGVTGHGQLTLAGSSIQFATQIGNVFNITAAGAMTWNTDNAYDIGTTSSGRPRNVFVAGAVTVNGLISTSSDLRAGSANFFYWNARSQMSSPSDGNILLQNLAATDFGRLQFGGTTSAFPALKRSGAALQVRLADDTADAAISASTFTASSSAVNISALASTGYSLTGSSTVSMVDLAGTWNTTGAPTGIKMNVTDVASSTSSLLMDLQTNGNSRFKVAKDGAIEARTITTTSSSVNLSAISSTGHSLTGSSAVSLVDLAGTWNTTGTPTAFKMNIINTNSNAASLLMDLQVNGSSYFGIGKAGQIVNQTNGIDFYTFGPLSIVANRRMSISQTVVAIGTNSVVSLNMCNSNHIGWTSDGGTSSDLIITREEFGGIIALAQRNSTNAQTFRLYNTFTDASNYERGRIQWSGNELRIGTESLGTGTLRSVGLYSGGTRYQIIGGSYNQFDQNIYMNAANIVTGTVTGFKIGTATNQKIGFWNATPIDQPNTAIAAATVASTGTGDVVAATTTFDGYTIPQIVKAMRDAGLLA